MDCSLSETLHIETLENWWGCTRLIELLVVVLQLEPLSLIDLSTDFSLRPGGGYSPLVPGQCKAFCQTHDPGAQGLLSSVHSGLWLETPSFWQLLDPESLLRSIAKASTFLSSNNWHLRNRPIIGLYSNTLAACGSWHTPTITMASHHINNSYPTTSVRISPCSMLSLLLE